MTSAFTHIATLSAPILISSALHYKHTLKKKNDKEYKVGWEMKEAQWDELEEGDEQDQNILYNMFKELTELYKRNSIFKHFIL